MKPDYKKAAEKAIETLTHYNADLDNIDPLPILQSLPNVAVIAYGAEAIDSEESFPLESNQDAFTLVNKKDGKLQYIVIYNQNILPFQINFALSRELGHVILQHDGSQPEEIWSEEANCFGYHFICPLELLRNKAKPINFRPQRMSLLWEMKEITVFDSIDSMKQFIVEDRNKFCKFIGNVNINYTPDDVVLAETCEYDAITGWRNCCDVILRGRTVGYCGE